MPRRTRTRTRGSQQFPSAFNELTFEKKEDFAFKARENDEYLAKIIDWLKDTTREHIQEEDDRIILRLYSKVDRFIAEGIVLPPPYIREYFTYTNDIIDYSKKYFENPHRDATSTEKKQMVCRIISHSSYIDKDINNLLDYSLIMSLEYNTDMDCNILNRLEKLEKTTVSRLFQHWVSIGELPSSDHSKMKELLANKVAYWKQEKNRARTIYGNTMNYNYPNLTFNRGIRNYSYAIRLINNDNSNNNNNTSNNSTTSNTINNAESIPLPRKNMPNFESGVDSNKCFEPIMALTNINISSENVTFYIANAKGKISSITCLDEDSLQMYKTSRDYKSHQCTLDTNPSTGLPMTSLSVSRKHIIGSPLRRLELGQKVYVLDSEFKNVEVGKAYLLEPTQKTIGRIVSESMLKTGHAVSADHCQTVFKDPIYSISEISVMTGGKHKRRATRKSGRNKRHHTKRSTYRK